MAGLRPDDACDVVVRSGLECARTFVNDGGDQLDVVVTQQPAARSQVGIGATVTIGYREGRVVPTVLGMGTDDACASITAAGFRCETRLAMSPSPTPPYTAFQQVPAENQPAAAGTTVTVSIDNYSYVVVTSCLAPNIGDQNPDSYASHIVAYNGGCPAGWHALRVGKLATTQAPGTVPVYHYRPVPGTDARSDRLLIDGTFTHANYQAPVILGYAFRADAVPTSPYFATPRQVLGFFGDGTDGDRDNPRPVAGNAGQHVYQLDDGAGGVPPNHTYAGVNVPLEGADDPLYDEIFATWP